MWLPILDDHQLTGVEVLEGALAYSAVAAEIEGLAVRTGVPVSARAAWTAACLDAEPAARPLAVLVRDATNRVTGAAVFVAVPRRGFELVTAPGGQEHRASFVTTDAASDLALAAGVVKALRGRPEPVRLRVAGLPAGDPVAHAIVRALPEGRLVPGQPIPVVQRADSTSVGDYLDKGRRRGLRRARKRLIEDGRTVRLRFSTSRSAIRGLLPDLEEICRRRDGDRGRRSELDNAAGRTLWWRRCERLLAERALELSALYVDGALAAYVLGVLDGSSYRVVEGRLVTSFARYSPGRLLEAAVLQRVLDDPAFLRLDWMTAVAPEALLARNAADDTIAIHADVMPS